MGRVALSVGRPNTPAPQGWRWTALTNIARLESGHTPSRRKAAYWHGDIPWIGIKDAKHFHGRSITDTLEHTTAEGIANSSARILPKDTVCLSRTASVGYVVKMSRDMATSQDFANWVCTPDLDPDFLCQLFVCEGSSLLKFASGSVHQTIYYPELKAFHVCVPSISEQKAIVRRLLKADLEVEKVRANLLSNLSDLDELKSSLALSAFSGH